MSTPYRKGEGLGSEIEGWPMDFREYDSREVARPGLHRGIILMIKEHRPLVYKYVIGIAIDHDGNPADHRDRDSILIQVNAFAKVGTGWFDNLVESLDQAGVLTIREGDDLERVDWRLARGTIVEVDLDVEEYEHSERGMEERNKVEKIVRARKAEGQGRRSGGGSRESREDRREREKDRRAGPWGDRDRGRGDDRSRRDERDERRGDRSRDDRDRDERPRRDDRDGRSRRDERDRDDVSERSRSGQRYGGSRDEDRDGDPDLPF